METARGITVHGQNCPCGEVPTGVKADGTIEGCMLIGARPDYCSQQGMMFDTASTTLLIGLALVVVVSIGALCGLRRKNPEA